MRSSVGPTDTSDCRAVRRDFNSRYASTPMIERPSQVQTLFLSPLLSFYDLGLPLRIVINERVSGRGRRAIANDASPAAACAIFGIKTYAVATTEHVRQREQFAGCSVHRVVLGAAQDPGMPRSRSYRQRCTARDEGGRKDR